MRWFGVCQYKVLLITVLLLLLPLVGNRDLSKNNAIAIDHSLRAVSCLNQKCESERGVREKMVITKYNWFICTARPQTKFGSHRKLCKMLRE